MLQISPYAFNLSLLILITCTLAGNVCVFLKPELLPFYFGICSLCIVLLWLFLIGCWAPVIWQKIPFHFPC